MKHYLTVGPLPRRFARGSLIFLFLTVSLALQGEDRALSGLLYGKNYYLPHLPAYSFPAYPCRTGAEGETTLSLGYTAINEFVAYDTTDAALDYESLILDVSFSRRFRENLLLGADSRLISYYGGFFDSAVEGWHGLFGFPNAGREYFDRNDLEIDIDNEEGRNLALNKAVLTLGDTDLYGVWNFFSRADSLNLALAGAVKLPTGSFSYATGSDYADLGLQVMGEWRVHPVLALHLQQGVVIPGDLFLSSFTDIQPYAVQVLSQTFAGLEFIPREDWALIAQARINTSPILSERVRSYTTLGRVTLFTLPQTSLQLGIKKALGSWTVQVHIEEDPFTYEGADILFSCRVTREL